MSDSPAKNRHPQVMRAISEKPWAILPQTLETIVELVALRARGGELSAEEVQARIGAGPAQRGAVVKGTIGVLPLYGVLFPRASLFTEMSGGTSVQQWGRDFDRMVADPDVDAILIDCHTPGGSTYLIAETAAKVRNARGQKPIVAIANALCASAGYHIASQADEVVASPSSLLGSIGVYMVHWDWSAFNEGAGIEPTYIYAGKYKTEGNPDEPLDAEAQEHFQELVDDDYKLFTADVAKGRGVRPAEVRNGFGQGRVVPANLAVELGIADRVDTFEGTLARIAKGAIAPSKARSEAQPSTVEISDEQIRLAAAQERLQREIDEHQADDEIGDEVLASLRELAADTRADIDARTARDTLAAIASDMRPHRQEASE